MSSALEKLSEIGIDWPEIAGMSLLTSVICLTILLVAFVAARFKGRSIIAWMIIAAAAQAIALLLPVAIIALTGLADPRDFLSAHESPGFSTFRLFAEMSLIAGLSTLAILGFLNQTKWKSCPACDAQIPWRAKTCPLCASSQTHIPAKQTKVEPGTYPRLKARTIHLPVELDAQLKQITRPLRKSQSMTENAAISQYVRQLLEKFDAEAQRAEKD